jgi:hypothetical protein
MPIRWAKHYSNLPRRVNHILGIRHSANRCAGFIPRHPNQHEMKLACAIALILGILIGLWMFAAQPPAAAPEQHRAAYDDQTEQVEPDCTFKLHLLRQ